MQLGPEFSPNEVEKTLQKPFALSMLPAPWALFPLHTRQREKSANHNTGKNVLPATSGLGLEEQLLLQLLLLLFSLILYCYCLVGGEKRRSVSISGGGRKWCDFKAWFHSCQLWSDSFWFSRMCQHKNSEHVRIVAIQSELFHRCLWRQRKRKVGNFVFLPKMLPVTLEAGAWRSEAAQSWHKECHSQPSHFSRQTAGEPVVSVLEHMCSTATAELPVRSPYGSTQSNIQQSPSFAVKVKTPTLPKQKIFLLPYVHKEGSRTRAFHPCWESETPWKHRAAPCPASHTDTHPMPICLHYRLAEGSNSRHPEASKGNIITDAGFSLNMYQGSTKLTNFVGPCKSLFS